MTEEITKYPPDPAAVEASAILDAIRADGWTPDLIDRLAAAVEEHCTAPDPLDGITRDSEGGEVSGVVLLERLQRVAPPKMLPLSAFAGKELPKPVLWMDSRRGGGTVLRTGEVAVLSGAGGVGKTFFSLGLAVAACSPGNGPGEAAGLHVRKGGAVLISLEGDPETTAYYTGLVAGSGPDPATIPDSLHFVCDPEPLMTAHPDRPGEAVKASNWRVLWDEVAKREPSLVIVDPASAALEGANQNDGATVRRFVRALGKEAKGKDGGGWGVLLIAHSTKTARFGSGAQALAKMIEGGGAVAGSGQWQDAARGVLAMVPDGPKRALVQCQKANHGPPLWVVALDADKRKRDGKPPLFAGWTRRKRFSPAEWLEEEERRKENGGETTVSKDGKGRGRLHNLGPVPK